MYYEALYGCMPFGNEDDLKVYQENQFDKKNLIKWPEKKTEVVDANAKELICQILNPDQTERISWEKFTENEILDDDDSGFEDFGDGSDVEEVEVDPENPPGLEKTPKGIEYGG